MSVNGSTVTRAELAAHIQRIDDSLSYIRGDIAEINADIAGINNTLRAPARWVGARLARMIDYTLVALVASVIAILSAHFTT